MLAGGECSSFTDLSVSQWRNMCWHESSCICLRNVKGRIKEIELKIHLQLHIHRVHWAEAAHAILISTILRWFWSWLPGMTTQGATWEAKLSRGLRYVKLDNPQTSRFEDWRYMYVCQEVQRISWLDLGKWNCGTMHWIVVRSSSVRLGFLRWSSEFFSGFGFGTSTGIFASRSLWCAWAKMEV